MTNLSSITFRWGVFLGGFLILTLWLRQTPATAQNPLWQDITESSLRLSGQRFIIPRHYRLVQANMAALDASLAQAQSGITLTLPLPNGHDGLFWIETAPLMQPDLAAKFPEIQTYRGHGLLDTSARVWLDRTPQGFHGLILSAYGTIYLDPYQQGDITHYISYDQRDFQTDKRFMEQLPPSALTPRQGAGRGYEAGGSLRTYRLAIATTGEYAQFFGGTLTQTEAAIVTTINRVRGIYERELGISFTLVDNTNLIFLDPNTDPYANTRDDISINQNIIDTRLGNSNYDVGHLVGTGLGGAASMGACISSSKAWGITGQAKPVGDPFDVDYVAHELGHQFSASHTFNAMSDDSTSGRCNSNNFYPSTAYEPGSGSSIMAYTGICEKQDLQPHSDAFFHTVNFDQIREYITERAGRNCGTLTATGNLTPTVDAGPDMMIPKQTPFNLTGTGQDLDGDTLTYSWEQIDLGQGWAESTVLPNTDPGFGPLFRSYPPMTSSMRTFPNPAQPLLAAKGEYLPTTTRILHFRLTGRDGRGGVSYDSLKVTVMDAGPWVFTSPITTTTWVAGRANQVSWQTAGTENPSLSCQNVTLSLSVDNGQSFAKMLAQETPNDGEAQVDVEAGLATTQARVKIACVNNRFFMVSPTTFTITNPLATPTPTPTATPVYEGFLPLLRK